MNRQRHIDGSVTFTNVTFLMRKGWIRLLSLFYLLIIPPLLKLTKLTHFIFQFCRIGKDCYWNVNRLSKNNEKLPYLHKITKKKFLVSNKIMRLCLYIKRSTIWYNSFTSYQDWIFSFFTILNKLCLKNCAKCPFKNFIIC